MNPVSTPVRLTNACVAVFLLSYAVLLFEIALTRVFSVMLSYHFVFAIVSTALLGLGLGGMLFQRWGRGAGASAIRLGSLLFPLALVAAVLLIVGLPIYRWDGLSGVGFWLYLLLALAPFCLAGLAIAGLFQEFAGQSGLLYGADLVGAALAAWTVVPAMDRLGGINVVFLAALAGAVAAVVLTWFRPKLVWPALAGALSLGAVALVLTLSGISLPVPVAKDPGKDMYRMLANPQYGARIIDSRWTSFGRTDLVQAQALPNEMTIFVDGAAGSAMYRLDAILDSPEEKAHLIQHFGGYFPFFFLRDAEKQTALAIGAGGGRDVVVALLGGVKDITAVEVNPEVVGLVQKYQDFNGRLYAGRPGVNPVVAEGRDFVRRSQRQYDIIMLSIPVTKSSRSVEGYALTENTLFTVEAFGDYLDHLTNTGRIIVVAHSDLEIYRLVAIALAAFAKRGLPEREAMTHLYTVASDMMPAMVIQKQALTAPETQAIHSKMHEMGFDRGSFFVPLVDQAVMPADERLGPGSERRMLDQYLFAVSKGMFPMATLVEAATVNIAATTDDSPFFFNFGKGLPDPFGVFAILIALSLAVVVVLVCLPRRPPSGAVSFGGLLRERPELKRHLVLFYGLGIGFMLIEVALLQKLMLYLGQPHLVLSVLLSALLLGGGLGSWLSARLVKSPAKGGLILALATALAVVPLALAMPGLFGLGWEPRLTAVLAILPLGLLMGCPFPLAVRSLEVHGLSGQTSVMWGINGVASVLGSALTMIIGLSAGFSWAIGAGSLVYVAVALCFVGLRSSAAR